MRSPREIGFVGYDQVNAFDLAGPMEVFDTANSAAGTDPPPYRLTVLSPGGAPFRAQSGLVMVPRLSLDAAPAFDTILVPGGAGLREPETNRTVSAWLAERLATTRRIATVCTGIYGLAPTGALDGCTATTHWRFARDVGKRFPAIRIEPDSLFVRAGSLYTSGGISAGIDLSLKLVAEDLGPSIAVAIAREMLVHAIRAGGQAQYSEPIRAQTRASDRLADLVAWIGANLDCDLTAAALAERAGLSERQLSRRFREDLGEPPAAFVERLRLDAAREALAGGALAVEAIAAMTGYASADAFRRAFARAFGIAPSEYRRAFPAMSGIVG